MRRGGMSIARALGSETRAGIYAHLREVGDERTVRDVAALFDLHPNVARTHLETLAEAGLVRVGRRKHPGGGRPAKVYTAIPDAPDGSEPAPGEPPAGVHRPPPADPTLLVRLLANLLDGPGVDASGRVVVAPAGRTNLAARAHETAVVEGRRLVSGVTGPNRGRSRRATPLADAAAAAVHALLPWAPEVRVVKRGGDWVDITGLRPAFAPLVGMRPELAEVLERGLLMGALAGAGAQVAVAEAGTLPGGGAVWRARAMRATSTRTRAEPSATVDARGEHREAGVVRALRRITGLRPGEVLEVLAEGPGAPAAFARWADRAGHQLLGVERATDDTGRPAIRLLIRKGS
jgi:TusA-related sulfurtransferase/DNA-binding transcriptional ArsR family regulator